MALTYATPEDLSEVAPDLDEATQQRYIRAASSIVRATTRTCLYDTTPAGLPSDTDVADAFRDAVVSQIEAWVTLGIDPTTGPAGITEGGKTAQSLLSGSITYATRADVADDKVWTLSNLVPLASDCLLDVPGLTWTQPAVW